ncbi:MAG TPA: hypothetical protein VHL34_09295 [Rhizomicrobium sp.]|jgi:ornithine cyclodeaminase|nr:hypothetical protein [Rhizomicrobium sp.]
MTKVVGWAEIERVLPGLDLLAAIESGFVAYSQGRATVPPVGELLFGRGEAHIKYGYIEGDATFCVKVATGFYDNPAAGLPSSNGLMLLFDAATGVPVAVLLDEGRLTDIRTAVAGAIAAKWLAPKSVEAIGVIGTGTQARLQVQQLKVVTACRKLYVYGRKREAIERYCCAMKDEDFEIIACATPALVAARANLIVTTTPADAPLLRAEDIRPGTHITAVGADTPEKNEIDASVFAKADRIVADSTAQCATRGDVHHALAKGVIAQDRIVELGAIIAGDAAGRQSDNEITIADLTGVAVQDITIAQAVVAALATGRKAA